MQAHGVHNLVFSSSATVYGDPQPLPVDEQHPVECIEEWHAVSGGGFARTAIGYHPGVSCDRTGQLPIVGTRYQLAARHLDPRVHPFGYDVCEAALIAMPAHEQSKYERIPPPCFASDEAPLLRQLQPHFAYVASGL